MNTSSTESASAASATSSSTSTPAQRLRTVAESAGFTIDGPLRGEGGEDRGNRSRPQVTDPRRAPALTPWEAGAAWARDHCPPLTPEQIESAARILASVALEAAGGEGLVKI